MTDTALATTEQQRDNRQPIVVLRDRLELRKGEIKAALPDDIKPEAFIRAVVTSATINPDILACSWQSVWIACMKACRDGLLPDGVEGAIVPYKSTATWIPMFQGLLRRFRRSGQFKEVKANVVREGEEFYNYIDETGEKFRHVPGDNFDAPITKVYALAATKDGGFFLTVMTIKEANKIRAMSRATREDAPWKLWPEEMYKKTALRRLSKVLPSARDIVFEDDVPEIEAPSTVAQITAGVERTSGPAAALEQFAGSKESPATDPQVHPRATGDGGGESDQATEINSGQRSSDADQTTVADDIQEAYRRGQEAKQQGLQRRAVPGEYRGNDKTALAAAWVKGFDGTPL